MGPRPTLGPFPPGTEVEAGTESLSKYTIKSLNEQLRLSFSSTDVPSAVGSQIPAVVNNDAGCMGVFHEEILKLCGNKKE